MKIEVDRQSGFCFGVVKAIKTAEKELGKNRDLFCLGDIVHNGMEINRLEKMGLKTVSREEYFQLKNCRVLIRAHGEPPETYQYAKKNSIELIDATCPVVLTLQKQVKASALQSKTNNGQVVVFGKKGHAEVIGLDGQTDHNAIIVESIDDIHKIDFSRPVWLYSQTTRRLDEFKKVAERIKSEMQPGAELMVKDTVCRQVSNRVPHLKKFVAKFDLILFVAGHKSSNGKYLFSVCKEENLNSFHISKVSEIEPEWFIGAESVGICGATSTPNWLMEKVASWVDNRFN